MEQMTTSHQTTYEAIFRQPLPGDLKWPEVRSMLVAVAYMVVEKSDGFEVSRNGRTLVLRPPIHEVLKNIEQLKKIREFLE